ncbi:MAG: tol-pal system-associated acyl-CoA thioesterase [Gallionellaceae bacterium]|jgi:acyl-CoA thioester hydrolase|nr:tol-pal system-associated acyl-CoA thioesterase [Gallionellaceae bacterium]
MNEPVFSLPVRVYFQDTDAGGVVYHASYVNFLERARTEWLRERCGYSNGGLLREFGVVFVVRSMKLRYLKPALLDDLLDVTAEVAETGRSRLLLRQHVQRDGETLVQAEVELVCVMMEGFKPTAMPEALREKTGL